MEGDFQVGFWLVSPKLNRIERDGRKLHLEPKAMQVLVYLAEQQGEVVSKEQLIHTVWADTFVTDYVLTHSISELRRAFEDDAKQPHVIETVPKGGYRLMASVTRGSPRAGTEAVPQAPASCRFRVIYGAGFMFVLVLLTVTYFGSSRLLRQSAPLDKKVMLAVLPFENLSGDPEQEYFSDGMTEEMITRLGQLNPERLGVIARGSVVHYKHHDKAVDQIGRELGVQYVLAGSIRRVGNHVRVSVQLIQLSDQTNIWAQSYDHDLQDILALQSDVAADIANGIRLKLSAQRQTQLAKTSPLNPEAYEAYLQGRYHIFRFSEADFRKAKEYFERSIRLDPQYAPAYAGVAHVWVSLGNQGVVSLEEAIPKARTAALKAIELDRTLAEAYAVLAWIEVGYDWNLPAASQELQNAIEINPNDPTAHHHYAYCLWIMGKPEAAVEEMKRARDLDPLSLFFNDEMGVAFEWQRQYDKAIEWFQKAMELDPNWVPVHIDLGIAYVKTARYEQGITEIKRAIILPGGGEGFYSAGGRIWLAWAYAATNKKDLARKILNEASRKPNSKHYAALDIARGYVALGDKNDAFAWLERAYSAHERDLIFLRRMDDFDPIRSDPRFEDLLRRIGMPQ
jgi:TolB-like protein/DNA-binding winged helix-turn-helix (wHTH) protein/Tfp pilus assembly protein PilF